MKVIRQFLIGLQINREPSEKEVIQTRPACLVEPYGDFVSDVDGDITEIKLIDPKDYKRYFDWGGNSDKMTERARENLILSVKNF